MSLNNKYLICNYRISTKRWRRAHSLRLFTHPHRCVNWRKNVFCRAGLLPSTQYPMCCAKENLWLYRICHNTPILYRNINPFLWSKQFSYRRACSLKKCQKKIHPKIFYCHLGTFLVCFVVLKIFDDVIFDTKKVFSVGSSSLSSLSGVTSFFQVLFPSFLFLMFTFFQINLWVIFFIFIFYFTRKTKPYCCQTIRSRFFCNWV